MEWISLTEVRFPKKCPNCGSREFLVSGARKVEFEAVYQWEKGRKRIKVVEDINVDCEWEVAYSVECNECHYDLSKDAGID